MAGELTALKIKAIAEPGIYGDGDGLYLRVSPSLAKSWFFRAKIAGTNKRPEIGIGRWPGVSLAEARAQAGEYDKQVKAGIDPRAEREAAKRKAEKIPTFEAAAKAVHELHRPTWRNEKHAKQFLASLKAYAFPAIGDLPVDRIESGDVLRVLTPIWTAKPETARRVRQRIRTVLKWAQASGHVIHNPAGEVIDGALPKMPKVKAHQRALPYRDVAEALAKVDGTGAWPATRLCFRFAVLTAARSGEARGARWNEIDMDAAIWTVPAGRMKGGKAHRVPLSDAALDVLRQARALSDGDGLMFPAPRGGMLSDSTVSKLLRENGIAAVPHGFRSSFRNWCAETGKPRELAEAALAHTVGGVEGAYFRSDLFEARRRLMADWARFLDGDAGAKVIPLHG